MTSRPDQDREDNGNFSPVVSDEDIIAAVDEHHPAATSEVADAVGVGRRDIHNRLTNLYEEGKVNRKQLSHAVVWYVDADRDI